MNTAAPVAVVLAGASTAVAPSPSFWGEVAPTWLSAIGTISAVVVSLVLLLLGQSERTELRRRQAQLDEEKAAEQASHVWVSDAAGGSSTAEAGAGFVRRTVDVHFGNNSTDTIGDVEIEFRVDPPVAVAMRADPQPEWNRPVQTAAIGRLLPHQENATTFTADIARLSGTREPVAHQLQTRIRFTDAAGRRWMRDENARLHRLSDDGTVAKS